MGYAYGKEKGFKLIGVVKDEIVNKFPKDKQYKKVYQLSLILYWLIILTGVWTFTILFNEFFLSSKIKLTLLLIIEAVIVYIALKRKQII